MLKNKMWKDPLQSNKSDKLLEKKAKELLSYANIFAIGIWEPFQKYPDLINKIPGNKHLKWDFYIKVAILWCAISEMKIQLSEHEYDKLSTIIEEQCIEWQPQSLVAIKDINNFLASYKNKLNEITSLEEAARFTRLLVGTWTVWNLTEKSKIQDEAEIAGAIGYVIHNSIKGYWTI